MKQLLLQYLQTHWDKNLASKIQFSPVPKGHAGDLALGFFEITKETKTPPPHLAQQIEEILKDCPLISNTEIAGPYLNITFTQEEFFQQVLNAPLTSDSLQGKEIVVEYSSPNTNKPLHLGHMRNHALGISLSNVLEANGAKVFRTSIVNDRGVHICKSMLAYQYFGNGETPQSSGIKGDHLVGKYYVRFEQESKKNPKLLEEVQQMLVDWEAGKPEVMQLWKQMNDWALKGRKETYARQGVTFDKEYHESDLYKEGKEYVLEGLEKGILKKKDGAIVIDLTDDGLDEKVLLRSNGTTIYMTQDIATTLLKQKEFAPDQQIWVVADEQNYHFKVLFLCLEKLGLMKPDQMLHLGYGLVHLPEGRMKSREGTVVDADNLMDELSGIAAKEIQKRDPSLTPKAVHTTAEQIMNAAWKFYLLSTSPRKSITFDTQKSIAFEGATGPYLQYAGVRIQSIFHKVGTPKSGDWAAHLGSAEKLLGVKILQYTDMLTQAAETKNPTYVVTYLLELAQAWSSYYSEVSILNAKTADLKNARLALAQKVYDTLQAGLNILGIEIPEQM